MKVEDVNWCRNLFYSLKVDGVWGIPRSGIVFRRTADGLKLESIFPEYDRSAQLADLRATQEHFAVAGIPVTDPKHLLEGARRSEAGNVERVEMFLIGLIAAVSAVGLWLLVKAGELMP